MTQPRAFRQALSPPRAAERLEAEAHAGRMDADAVNSVLTAAGHQPHRTRGQYPAGLSDREVEVLRLLARGETKKEIAARLHVSASTAHTHVVHIYEKTGVTSRAAVALFAMEHDLLRD